MRNSPQDASTNADHTSSQLNNDRPPRWQPRPLARTIPRLPGGPGRKRFPEKEINGVPHKWCDHCKQFKLMTDFRYDKNKGRRMTPCNACAYQNLRRWRRENKERYNEYQRNLMKGRKHEQSEGNEIQNGN